MLVRMMYASRAVPGLEEDALMNILRHARVANPQQGITGALCCSNGIFLQVLEGGRMAVNALYNRIANDKRHTGVVILSYSEIRERRFAGWAMGQVNMARMNPGLLLKYSETATLDPYAVSGEAMALLFDEVVATAAIMGQS